ncbi:MAG: metallophosphoesterase [Thermoleophilia bacterium]|nr:metallophosphoesterase [Thermoleophilia bacterium]
MAIALLAIPLFVTGCGNGASSTDTLQSPAVVEQASTVGLQPSYIFAVCGDNRTMGIESGVLPKIIESAKARGAVFMVDTGDVTESGEPEELLLYRNLTEASGLRFYTVPGNHDVGSGGVSDAYEQIIGSYYFSFDYAGDNFIVVDNADDRTGIDAAQMQWLKENLDSGNNKPHQFIFAHIPVTDPSLPSDHVSGEKGGEGLRSGQAMVEMAGSHANMDAFFFGHIHAYLAYSLYGIDAYVTGGAGAPLYFPENAGGYYHYLLVNVYPDRVNVEVVRI